MILIFAVRGGGIALAWAPIWTSIATMIIHGFRFSIMLICIAAVSILIAIS